MKKKAKFLYQHYARKSGLAKIGLNIAWLFFDKFLRMGVGLLVGVWIARYLGPEQFGILSFAMAFVSIFSVLSGLGLQGIVVRDIAKDMRGVEETLGTAACLQIIGGVFAYSCILTAINFVQPNENVLISMVAIIGTTVLFEASKISIFWFEARVESKYTVWVQNSNLVAFAFVKVFLILNQSSLVTFAWIFALETAIASALLLWIMDRRGPSLKTLRVTVERAKYLIRDSWPLILSSFAITIYMRTDQIMLGQMKGNVEVGIYTAATRISEVWYFLPTAILASVFPSILNAKRIDHDLYRRRFEKLYVLMIMISMPLALLVTLFSTFLITNLFGDDYSDAIPVLTIHIWAAIFVFLGVASGHWFLAENKQLLALERTVIGVGINICLNYFLIPIYGAVGAAWATLASQVVASWLYDLLRLQTQEMFKMKLYAMNPLSWYKLLSK